MKKSIFLIMSLLVSYSTLANDLAPVAVQSSTPDQNWFYNLEDVVFDADDSYVPNGYINYTKWYVNGVYQTGGSYYRDMSICFALPDSPANDCYQMSSGQTTVQVKLEVQSNHGYWHSETVTYTIQEHKGRKYFVKDHLGSVRTTVNRDGNVLGYDDYYPFGLVMPGRSSNSANPNDNYKFTGHERDDEAGLTLDYMMARNYDPITGRFLQIDPSYAKYPAWSPYAYTFNNPMLFTDPDGQDPCIKTKKGCKTLKPIADVYNKARRNEETLRPLANLIEENGPGSLSLLGTALNHILTPTAPLLDISGNATDYSTDEDGNKYANGVKLRNGKLAGENHPTTGVPFDENGLPDFSNFLYEEGTNDVMIKSTGSRNGDVKKANARAGYDSTPEGYVWHHHQDKGRMQLVRKDAHTGTGHTGGVSIHKKAEEI